MKRANLLWTALIVSIFSFLWIGCEMGSMAIPDIRGDWRQTNRGGKNAVADLQITSTKVFCSAAKGYGSWNDQGTYTYDYDLGTFTVNLNDGGSTTYQYSMSTYGGEPASLTIRYISGDGRKLIEGTYERRRLIDY